MLMRIARNNPGDGSRIVHHYMQLTTDLADWIETLTGSDIAEILRPTLPSIDPDHPHARAQEERVTAQLSLEPLDSQERNYMSALIDFRNARLTDG